MEEGFERLDIEHPIIRKVFVINNFMVLYETLNGKVPSYLVEAFEDKKKE